MRSDHTGSEVLTYEGVEMEIDYTYEPGQPETGPSYASGGEPGYPASVSIQEVYVDGNSITELCEAVYVPIAGSDKFQPMLDDLALRVLESVEASEE